MIHVTRGRAATVGRPNQRISTVIFLEMKTATRPDLNTARSGVTWNMCKSIISYSYHTRRSRLRPVRMRRKKMLSVSFASSEPSTNNGQTNLVQFRIADCIAYWWQTWLQKYSRSYTSGESWRNVNKPTVDTIAYIFYLHNFIITVS